LQYKWRTLALEGGRRIKMTSTWSGTKKQRAAWIACTLLIALPAFAQASGDPMSGPPAVQQAAPLLSPDQLNNLVAPIALYPDPLLSQVLSASTYPLEIIEAQQWLGHNSSLQGTQLMDAARQQNWDPSIQALVAFPNALSLLANDIRWTTDLGNAFLGQQADVMSAIQIMRARAKSNGKLATTLQQVVTTATQSGQDAIVIQPADPQVIYVPVYSPTYVWGPPVWGAYPSLWYPAGFGFGFGFGPAYYMSSYFPSWGGWGGWGWGCGWFGSSLYVNVGFFNHYGYYGGGYGHHGGYAWGAGYGGHSAWMHDPGHRMGIPYPNRTLSNQYGGANTRGVHYAAGARTSGGQWNGGRYESNRTSPSNFNRSASGVGTSGGRSPASGDWQRFGSGNRPASAGQPNSRGFTQFGNSGSQSGNRADTGSSRQNSPNYSANGGPRSYQPQAQGGRGYNSAQNNRSSPSFGQPSSPGYSAPRGGGASAPRSSSAPSRSYSAPRSFSGSHSSGGGAGFSGGRSGGGSGASGGRSGGGGGHHR
jgi:hypothetical protein